VLKASAGSPQYICTSQGKATYNEFVNNPNTRKLSEHGPDFFLAKSQFLLLKVQVCIFWLQNFLRKMRA